MTIDAGGQHVLERTSVIVDAQVGLSSAQILSLVRFSSLEKPIPQTWPFVGHTCNIACIVQGMLEAFQGSRWLARC